MSALKYTVIKSIAQYNAYCKVLEQLLETGSDDPSTIDEVDLVTLLIEKYDEANNTFREVDPVALLRSFMTDHDLKAKDLVELLGVSKGYVSDILNYKKGLSKDVIRKLAERFKVAQEAFNRPYKLHVPENLHLRNTSVMNTTKELVS
ncbi:helix-turn-helix domain-containing protein [Hufsiella ginkgonis]|uniref:Helix-turn-helix domain-containing protein n=1 Tax=Hufsiella ginkgonis TaxID=2695274 RepID=A0A7K1Y0E5_9SPHI|nr:helix-turn-helix domain-containing protein [Hufsiella ginkgonis]MXV16548.1 helix-turn-helix domain-containing protein [Hufsiella ginkgonis]